MRKTRARSTTAGFCGDLKRMRAPLIQYLAGFRQRLPGVDEQELELELEPTRVI